MTITAGGGLPLQLEKTDRKKQQMPIGKYFKGHGDEVMSDMQDRYGDTEGKRVFYATANKRGMTADDGKSSKPAPKKKTFGQRVAGQM